MIGNRFAFHIFYRIVMLGTKHFCSGKTSSEFNTFNCRNGKSNMRKRADELAGHITWRDGTLGGTRVLLSLPLERAAAGKGAL